MLEELTKWGQRKRVVAFIDNDKEKQMFGVGGVECISINDAIKKGAQNDIVLISPVISDEIVENLKTYNFNNIFCTSKWMRKNKYYKPVILKDSDYEKAVPFNHYESPYPDIIEIHEKEKELFDDNKEILDIDFNVKRQLELIDKMKKYKLPRWSNNKESTVYRYHYMNGWFDKGSADALYYMMRILNPQRIIEVGSGFSTAVMMDVNEYYFNQRIQITSIESRAERLKSLLKADDHLEIIEENLQNMSVMYFEKLKENDILFIDSSHVSKMNSDVNYLFFEILPRLTEGVYIHFHDVMYPFLYHKEWIYQGRAYNEMYLLRAFLMNNRNYSIQLFGDMLTKKYSDSVGELRGCGQGSFWMRKESK